jgi:thymidylate kinase/thymidylate synthase ThyX
MEDRQGIFIVIEGTDGAGKSTQFELLNNRLTKADHELLTIKFPRYDEPSSYFVREYLAGNYGEVDEIGPYTASLFYALDRYAAAEKIRKALTQGKVVLADRFTGSNMAHQGTKFHNADQRRGYFIWLDNLEFEMLKIPRPDFNVVLRVPAKVAQSLVDKKSKREYTDKKRDLHEADLGHLERAVEVYDDLCQLFPKDFTRIDCVRSGDLLSVETISGLLWEKIQPLLPKPSGKSLEPKANPVRLKTADAKAESPTVATLVSKPEENPSIGPKHSSDENPYVDKAGGQTKITDAGREFLEKAVADGTGNVYAFKDTLNPVTISAAMARLSRRGDDMRLTLLDEFANALGKDEKLLHRVITAYGDDSVQQLAGIHIVVEDGSQLLTKKLEWGRLAAYLEQSTRYIYYDKKNENGQYKYFTPEHFTGEILQTYREYMDAIFDNYSEMVHKLTDYVREHSKTPETERDIAWNGATRAQACDAARAVLPVATSSTTGIFASGQAIESLIMHLQSDELPEARETGHKILSQARQIFPAFLERADKPERGGAWIAYRANTAAGVKKLAKKYLPENHARLNTEPVKLTGYWPRNEIDLVPDMLYEHSSLSLSDLESQVGTWPYEKKLDIIKAYMGERLNRRHRPGRALENAHYSWDIVCDYGIFRDLQRHRMVDDLEWQALTPRYGYEVPQLVEDAGLADLYEACFDLSLGLYSKLQGAGYELEAQYATLLGHRMRWKITYNAREAFHFHELRTSPQGHPGYRKLVLQMHEKLAEVHPILAESMKFVNQDEDPELTRLAAERYTQFKIQQLE